MNLARKFSKWPIHRVRRPSGYAPQFRTCEMLQQKWELEHPEATREERAAAFRRIAEDCGI